MRTITTIHPPTPENPLAGLSPIVDEIRSWFAPTPKEDVTTGDTDADTTRQSFIDVITTRLINGTKRALTLGANLLSVAFGVALLSAEALVEGGVVWWAVNGVASIGTSATFTGVFNASVFGVTWTWLTSVAASIVAHISTFGPVAALVAGLSNPYTAVIVVAATLAATLAITVLYFRGRNIAEYLTFMWTVVFSIATAIVEVVRNIAGAALFALGAAVAGLNAALAWALFTLKWALGRVGLIHTRTFTEEVAQTARPTTTKDEPKGQHPAQRRQQQRKSKNKGQVRLAPVTA